MVQSTWGLQSALNFKTPSQLFPYFVLLGIKGRHEDKKEGYDIKKEKPGTAEAAQGVT